MTKKEIYKKVFEILEQKRTKAISVAESNKALALNNAEYLELEREERVLNMEIGKLKFENADVSNLVLQLEDLQKQKSNVLSNLGLSESDMFPQFECAKCGDTGVSNNAICTCANQLANNILMQNCGVDLSKVPDFENYDYKFFDDETERQFAQKCVDVLTDYVNNLSNIEMKNIFMCGASGTGKTYLTRCLAKELVKKGYTTLFLSSFDLNNMFLAEHLASNEQKDGLKDLIDTDCIVIDDLGTEPMRKNITKEYLLLLLNERLTKNKATIITSNLSPEHILFRYEERIFSRIFNKRSSLILEFKGKNHRLSKKQ